MSNKLTYRQKHVLARLAESDYVSFVGHMSSAAKRLVSAGYAIHIGPDKWTGQIFQITDAGRLALSDSKETDRG